MAAPASVYATDPMQVASATNSIGSGPSLSTAQAGVGVLSAGLNFASLGFQTVNQMNAYKTEARNAAASSKALKQERENVMRVYDRESRQLAANQTLSFIMSGLEAGSSDSSGENTVENVQRITSYERAADRQAIYQNYQTEIDNAKRQENAAKKAAKNSMWSGIAQGAAMAGMTALMLFSDERLKERLIPVGKSKNGLTIYLGRYTKESGLDDGKLHLFLIAQEVQRIRPNAVKIADNGYFQVDYAAALL